MMLYRALDRIMPAYRALFTRHGITEPQWRVLRVIWSSRNVTSRMLAERTLLSPPSLVSIIDRLEAKGLVTRVRSVEDRRAAFVVATADGRALQERVMPEVALIQERLRGSLPDEGWSTLEALLDHLSTDLSTHSAQEVRTA